MNTLLPQEYSLNLLRAMLGEQADFRPGQWESIQSLLSGHHTLTVMPTGAGKSFIFQLAALVLGAGLTPAPTTLVISPLIALMKDQVDGLTRRNIPATYINSALPAAEQAGRLENLAKGEYRIVYVAPERLRSVQFLSALRSQKICLLAVDEAHCISEWGHDFRPDYLHIAQARATFGNPLTAALTATATPQVQKDIIRLLGLGDSATRIVTGFNRPNLSLNVRYTSGPSAKLRALNELLDAGLRPASNSSVIVYTGTRRDAEEVAEFACEVDKIPAGFYHAGLSADERTRVQDAFINGKINLIAATNAFGMGIDRADIRQVIHYSLPGSLEAYYQEAGRAGRDGLPAQATLLYDPQDRALHEFFIQQSGLVVSDLQAIHNTIRSGESWLTVDELSRITGLHPVQLKVGLSALERAGALEHLGDEGYRMMFRKGAWDPKEIESAASHSKEHIARRQSQLNGIVHYAETNACRRQIILRHFGDTGQAKAAECCDNCRVGKDGSETRSQQPGVDVAQMNHGERAALIMLDTIRRLNPKVGKGKLAQILNGSKAQDILKFHYERNVYYAKLAALKQDDIEGLAGQLVERGYLKVIGGEYPVLSLTPKGEIALKQKEAIALTLPGSFSKEKIKRKQAQREAGSTLEYTARLFAEGKTPAQITQERGLSPTTIYMHLADLIKAGRLTAAQVVPAQALAKIEAAIRQVGSTQYLAPIKELLPDEPDYNLIRCVAAGWQQTSEEQTSEVSETSEVSSDSIESFLNKSHPRPLTGPWRTGWSLGFHSRFSGGDWSRSDVGDLTYRLKYQGDLAALPTLVEQTLEVIAAHPELAQVDAVLPVPPSRQRETDPVRAFCVALSDKIEAPMQTIVVKTRQTLPQKEMKTLAQKRANVAGAFALRGEVKRVCFK